MWKTLFFLQNLNVKNDNIPNFKFLRREIKLLKEIIVRNIVGRDRPNKDLTNHYTPKAELANTSH